MRLTHWFIAAGLLAQGLSIQAAPQESVDKSAPLPGYKLAWADEFDGPALDTAKWDYRTDSKALSTQKPENVAVGEGRLRLGLKKEEARGKQFTGAGVISKKTFKYGYYEARFKTPPGAGWHTSFWMQTHDGSGGTAPKATLQELDVCENDSGNPRQYAVNVHKWNPAPHKVLGGKGVKTPDLSADFHVFGCEFTPQAVKYYFDGKLVQTVDASAFEHSDHHIWLTSIAYGKNNKVVNEGKLPAAAEYDYVRFYEKR